MKFLRNELNEKNLLIRTLINRNREIEYSDTNDDVFVPEKVSEYDTTRSNSEISQMGSSTEDITFSPVLNSTTEISDNNENNDDEEFFQNIFKEYQNFERIELKKNQLKEKLSRIVKYLVDQKTKSEDNRLNFVRNSPMSNKSSVSGHESNTTEECMSSSDKYDSRHKYDWQKHSSGLASRIIDKMGYKGRGLGKNEDGIEEAIQVDDTKFKMEDTKTREGKLLYIASSSMLNQMDEERLSRGNIKVKVRCHGGCTVKCMYSHLPEMFDQKPDFVLLHIGSNDCIVMGKISDVVLQEIRKLAEYISWNLPYAKLILSLPIVRADNSTANAVQKNLKFKMKRLFYPCLDNSNVGLSHLGKKGLHLNNHGTRLVARNIISLIKRL